MTIKLKELAGILGAELSGPGDVEITGVAGIESAVEGSITFIAEKHRVKDLEKTRAAAALVPLDAPALSIPQLRVKNPRLAFARAIELFHVKPYRATGISERASIGVNASVGADPSIHAFVVVDEDARIGARVTLYPGVYVGKGSIIGDDSIVYANVSIGEKVVIGKRVIVQAGAVIGGDGFGFVTDGGKHHKIPQVGGVIIEDDVEIGANSTIDRATLGNTLIRRGTKIDNLVQVAHNVTIGEHCLMAAQVGIAGSSTLGNYVVLGGQAGVADHMTVGDRVTVAGGAGITRDVEPGEVIAGYPILPIRDWLKVQAVLPKLPELKRSLAGLEKQVQELKERISELTRGEKKT
jgi:UDP-3-O-[3-hydroxymyristoyl] glucosamine N-acyltransferase